MALLQLKKEGAEKMSTSVTWSSALRSQVREMKQGNQITSEISEQENQAVLKTFLNNDIKADASTRGVWQ